jgi:RsbT co-antagonist protein rsbRD N-terminal domain
VVVTVINEELMINPAESVANAKEKSDVLEIESVADILERDLDAVIQDWLSRVEKEPDLACIPLNFEERTGHLPQLLHDVIARLRLDAGSKAPISEAAGHHGDLRRKQGYTVAMAVEESRLLQVSIFSMLHKDVKRLEFSTLLPDVVTIADEVDAQLKQQMLRFMAADAARLAKGN